MIKEFRYAYIVRSKFIDLVQSLSTEQLNKIPDGFNNNIAWHLGHLVISTEKLSYVRSGVQADRVIKGDGLYSNGTKPEAFIAAEEIAELVKRMTTSLETIEQDYAKGIFNKMIPYSTHTFGFELNTIEDVFECCAYHDTVHWGNVMAMRKLVL